MIIKKVLYKRLRTWGAQYELTIVTNIFDLDKLTDKEIVDRIRAAIIATGGSQLGSK